MRLLLILIVALNAARLTATHIVGGGFSLQHLSGQNYTLTFTMLRDCQNGQAPFNQTALVGVFDAATHLVMDTFVLRNPTTSVLNPTKANCATSAPGCTDQAIYKLNIKLPVSKYNNNAGYYLSWQRCCRNHIIKNIQQPGDAGIAYYLWFASPKLIINSTPKPTANPFTVLCKDNLYKQSLSFKDAEGDSLSYGMIDPVNGTLTRDFPNDDNATQLVESGPYKAIVWNQGYDDDNAINGSPPLNINVLSGEITAQPNETGVFVFAIRVNEYRNGQLISSTNWEFQYTVIECISNIPPKYELFKNQTKISGNSIYVTVPDSIIFSLTVSDEEELDSVELYSGFSSDTTKPLFIFQNKVVNSNKQVTFNWKWQTSCLHNNLDKVQVKVIATDKGCPIPKVSQFVFYVHVLPMPLFPGTDVLCLELKDKKQVTVHYGDSSNKFPYFKHFILYKSTNNGPFVAVDSSTDYKNRKFENIEAAQYDTVNYAFMIRVKNQCDVLGISSDTLSTFDQIKASPQKQHLYNVTVANNKNVVVCWNKSTNKTFARYLLYKGLTKNNTSGYFKVADFTNITDTTFVDTDVDVNQNTYCYYLMLLDTCGNYSYLGQSMCSILLKGKSNPFSHDLSWQAFITADDRKPEYLLQRNIVTTDLQTEFGYFNYSKLNYTDNQLNPDYGYYQYTTVAKHRPVTSPFEAAFSASNTVDLVQDPLVWIPNAFTPNADGKNDDWFVQDVFVKNYLLQVFNAWGQLIFETKNKNNKWDGKDLNGKEASTGVYVYRISYDGWDQETRYKTGNVSILK